MSAQAPVDKAGLLPVSEVFHSFQGEGTLIGAPSTFIRLSGCNYQCTWCDTPYTWKPGHLRPPEWQTVEHLAGIVRHRHVVITGGEPLIHDLAPLLGMLGSRHVTIETNASRKASYPQVSLWSLSPKLSSSGHSPDAEVIQHYLTLAPHHTQLKFVIGDKQDLNQVKALLGNLPDSRHVPIVLQPLTPPELDRLKYLDAFGEWVLAVAADSFWQDFHLQTLPQLHRLCWPNREGI